MQSYDRPEERSFRAREDSEMLQISQSANPDLSFLDDPHFREMIDLRVERLMTQNIAGMPATVKEVTVEQGARILTFYALRRHGIEINDPKRFRGRHDIEGTPVWHTADPLYKNREAIILSLEMITRAKKLSRQYCNADPLLFIDEEALDDELFARRLLEIDGFNWIYLSDRLKSQQALALLAITNSTSVFKFIVEDPMRPCITPQMACDAMKQDGSLFCSVPPELVNDDLLTIAVDNGGGSTLPYAERHLGSSVWDNRERTLKAIRTWPPVIKHAPERYFSDSDCLAILLSHSRERVMVIPQLPERIQCHPDFIAVIVDKLPERPNLFGWLCKAAQTNEQVSAAHKRLLS